MKTHHPKTYTFRHFTEYSQVLKKQKNLEQKRDRLKRRRRYIVRFPLGGSCRASSMSAGRAIYFGIYLRKYFKSIYKPWDF